jgi:hypothetical protein
MLDAEFMWGWKVMVLRFEELSRVLISSLIKKYSLNHLISLCLQLLQIGHLSFCVLSS